MLTKIDGIVLHSIKQGESGRILKVFTRQRGLISFFVRSAYSKKKGSQAALFQSLNYLEIEADIRESRSLQTIRHLSTRQNYVKIFTEPVRSCIALFMAEVFLKSIEEEEESEELFVCLATWVDRLEHTDRLADIAIHFMLNLTDPLGFYPNTETKGSNFDLREGQFTNLSLDHKDFLQEDISASLRSYHGMGFVASRTAEIDREQRRRLLEGLMQYYRVHIPQFGTISSFNVLVEVFNI